MRKPFKIIMKSGAVIELQAETFQTQYMGGSLLQINVTGSDTHVLYLDTAEVAAILQPLDCEPQAAESEG